MSEASHYHCACEECWWGTIVDSTEAADAAVQEHEAKTDHAWVVTPRNEDGEVLEE